MNNRTRVIVTGSRHHTDRGLIWGALDDTHQKYGPLVVVHGGAAGADALAAEWVEQHPGLDCDEERHPAAWARLGRAAGPIRNQAMVAEGAALCLAFPLAQSKGTLHCAATAIAAGIPVLTYTSGP